MIKILSFLALITSMSAFAQISDIYYFSSGPNCTIKEYKPGALTPVDTKSFHGTPLKAKRLNRNPQFMAFKVAGKIYISPTACLKTNSLDSLEELEADSFDEEGRRDTTDYGKRLHAADYGQKIIKEEKLSAFKNDYYLEFDLGIVNVGSKEPTYPNYDEYTQVIADGVDTINITAGDAEGSSYKTKMAINIGAGKRLSPIQFLSFKFRRYSGESTDSVPMNMTFSDGSPDESTIADIKFEDTVMDVMVGSKFILMPHSQIHPILGAYLGVSLTSSKAINAVETKLSSSAFVVSLEGGAETRINDRFGLGATLGYQYVTKRKFKVSNDPSNLYKTFSSDKSYSNLSLNAGVRVYF